MGGAVILAWLLAAALAPMIAPYAPDTVNVAGRLAEPSLRHWLGTDELGRDVLTRIIYGARTSLTVGFAVVLIGGAAGTLGRRGRRLRGRLGREILMRATDLMFCFPPIILAMAIAAALGIGTRNTVIAMLVVWWPKFARLARSLWLAKRSLEYVAAPAPSVSAHPHSVPPNPAQCRRPVGRSDHARPRNAILVFAGLSFLGLGVVPPDAGMGLHGLRRARAGRAMVGGDLPGRSDPDGGNRLQLRRRRPARLA